MYSIIYPYPCALQEVLPVKLRHALLQEKCHLRATRNAALPELNWLAYRKIVLTPTLEGFMTPLCLCTLEVPSICTLYSLHRYIV